MKRYHTRKQLKNTHKVFKDREKSFKESRTKFRSFILDGKFTETECATLYAISMVEDLMVMLDYKKGGRVW